MASIEFVYNRTPGKLEEFITKLQSVGVPDRMGSEYPKAIGFGSSHARGFPAVLKYAGLLDSSSQPNDAYKQGLRGGTKGRALVGSAIAQAYKPLFDMYPDAPTHSEPDLVTFVKSRSNLNDELAGLVIKTFKVLCKFGDFLGAEADDDEDRRDDAKDDHAGRGGKPRRTRDGGHSASGVVINVNIALSVDATSDPAVYDAFFAAMAKHLGGLTDGT